MFSLPTQLTHHHHHQKSDRIFKAYLCKGKIISPHFRAMASSRQSGGHYQSGINIIKAR
jgi:hypothetical protein